MTSRKSFFNFEIMAESVKQSKYIMILHTIALFLMTTITTYMTLQKIERAESSVYYESELSMWLSGFNPLVGFAVIAISVITVIYLFSYLFKPNSVQFINSMPYTRGCMYVSRFAACVVSVIIPVLLVFAVNSVVYAAMGLGEYFPYADMLTGLGTELLCYFTMLCVCVFAMSLSGNFFAMLIAAGFVGLCYLVTTGALTVSFMEWFDNLSIYFSYEPSYLFPPLMMFYQAFAKDLSCAGYIYGAVYGVVFFALGLWAYVKRRSENTNKFFAYKGVGVFLKYYVSLVGSLFFGALFLALSNDNIIVGYIGYLLILFVVYVMLQAVFEKDMRSMFSNMKHFAVFAVIWALILIPLNEGVLGNIGPKRENLKAVSVSYGRNEITLRDKSNIDAAFELLESTDKTAPEGESYTTVTFKTNPDNPVFTIERTRYATSYEQLDDYEKQVFNSEEYRDSLLEALGEEYDYAWIELAAKTYSVRPITEASEMAAYDGYDLKGTAFNELRDILKGEIVKYDYETCIKSGCFAVVQISFDRGGEYFSRSVPVYLCYEEAVRFMKEDLNISSSGYNLENAAAYVKLNGEEDYCVFITMEPDEIETLFDCSAGYKYGFLPMYIELWYDSGVDKIYISYEGLSDEAKAMINPEGKDYENLPKVNENIIEEEETTK